MHLPPATANAHHTAGSQPQTCSPPTPPRSRAPETTAAQAESRVLGPSLPTPCFSRSPVLLPRSTSPSTSHPAGSRHSISCLEGRLPAFLLDLLVAPTALKEALKRLSNRRPCLFRASNSPTDRPELSPNSCPQPALLASPPSPLPTSLFSASQTYQVCLCLRTFAQDTAFCGSILMPPPQQATVCSEAVCHHLPTPPSPASTLTPPPSWASHSTCPHSQHPPLTEGVPIHSLAS